MITTTNGDFRCIWIAGIVLMEWCVKVNKDYDYKGYKNLSNGKVLFQFKSNDKQVISARLSNSCHNRFLPHKVYSGGDRFEQNLKWDNFNKKIFRHHLR